MHIGLEDAPYLSIQSSEEKTGPEMSSQGLIELSTISHGCTTDSPGPPRHVCQAGAASRHPGTDRHHVDDRLNPRFRYVWQRAEGISSLFNRIERTVLD